MYSHVKDSLQSCEEVYSDELIINKCHHIYKARSYERFADLSHIPEVDITVSLTQVQWQKMAKKTTKNNNPGATSQTLHA